MVSPLVNMLESMQFKYQYFGELPNFTQIILVF